MNKPIILFLLLLLIASGASADDFDQLSSVQDYFENSVISWQNSLKKVAQSLLMTLATISFTWRMALLALRGADLQEIVTEAITMIMIIGLFTFAISNATTISTAIIDSFKQAGALASGAGGFNVSVSAVLSQGLQTASNVYEQGDGIAGTIVYTLFSIIIMAGFVFMAGVILLAIAEAYVVNSAGIIFLGFGGHPFTSDYAKRYFTYCIAVGAKLYTSFLTLGLASSVINQWAAKAAGEVSIDILLSITSIVFIFVILIKNVPNLVQSMITGASMGNEVSSMGRAVNSTTAATTGAIGAVGGALKGGTALASEGIRSAVIRNQQATGNSLGTTGGGAGDFLKGVSKTAVNAAKAMSSSTAETAKDNAVGSIYSGNNLLSQSARNLREKNTAEKLGLEGNYVSPATDLTKKG